MTLIESFVQDNVFVDFCTDILYGSERINLNQPRNFATVEFELVSTPALCRAVDKIRMKHGYAPMETVDGYTSKMRDQGFYNFYFGINEWTDTKANACIDAVVCNSNSPDDEELYSIDLGPDEQIAMYNRVDEQCRKYAKKSCAELLSEARKEMEKDV